MITSYLYLMHVYLYLMKKYIFIQTHTVHIASKYKDRYEELYKGKNFDCFINIDLGKYG